MEQSSSWEDINLTFFEKKIEGEMFVLIFCEFLSEKLLIF
jgi:hypothetical protein